MTNHKSGGESDTQIVRREVSRNVSTLVTASAGTVVAILLAILGYAAKYGFESIETKLDSHTAAQQAMQMDLTVIKTQLPQFDSRLDKVESAQGDMWRRINGETAPAIPSGTKPGEH